MPAPDIMSDLLQLISCSIMICSIPCHLYVNRVLIDTRWLQIEFQWIPVSEWSILRLSSFLSSQKIIKILNQIIGSLLLSNYDNKLKKRKDYKMSRFNN